MTPSCFAGDIAGVDSVDVDGGAVNGFADNGYAVRPVVSLKSDAITGGDGTMNNPFTVG